MSILQALKAVATGLIGAAGAGILLLALTGHNEIGYHLSSAQFDGWALGIAIGSIILIRRFKIGPFLILILSAGIGIFAY